MMLSVNTNLNIQMPTPEEIDAAFEEGKEAVVALFARVEVQVSELAREFTTQATALIEVVYSCWEFPHAYAYFRTLIIRGIKAPPNIIQLNKITLIMTKNRAKYPHI